MIVKFKKLHPEAVTPSYAREGDAGLDITAISGPDDSNGRYVEYRTGLAVEIPTGYVGLVFPRSSISKYNLSLSNSVGVIDSGYRGEILFRFNNVDAEIPWNKVRYKTGDRIGQIMIIPIPTITFVEVDNLSSTSRGEGGFGST